MTSNGQDLPRTDVLAHVHAFPGCTVEGSIYRFTYAYRGGFDWFAARRAADALRRALAELVGCGLIASWRDGQATRFMVARALPEG